jgi:hypothetical protein
MLVWRNLALRRLVQLRIRILILQRWANVLAMAARRTCLFSCVISLSRLEYRLYLAPFTGTVGVGLGGVIAMLSPGDCGPNLDSCGDQLTPFSFELNLI